MLNQSKIEKIIFSIGLLLQLMPILAVDFFVTGDGPCHLYNSKILLDWYSHQHRDFYQVFYLFSPNFDPNWLFNLMTAPLLMFLHPAAAEKTFLVLYILCFAFGFRLFLRQINPQSVFLSTVALLFCQHKMLFMGFYNNSISFALWFWVAGWWWKNRNHLTPASLLILTLLLLLTYSAHPMGLVFSGFTILCLMAGLWIYEWQHEGTKPAIARLVQRSLNTLVCAMPAIVLLMEFAFRRDWAPEQHQHKISGLLESVVHLDTLVALSNGEKNIALGTSLFCIAIFIGAVALRIFKRSLQPADGLLLLVLVCMFCIVRPPASMSGGLEVSLRMAIVPYFALLFWSATANFPVWGRLLIQIAALVWSGLFLTKRLPSIQSASDLAKEVFETRQYVKPNAVIMALNYDYTGKTPQGNLISERVPLLGHVDCYIGAAQPAIISDNYEANYGYFPTYWRWQTGLNGQTDKDGINFYHRPPRADLLSYNRRTGQNIDYVLLVNYREEFKDHAYTQEIFAQLEQGFVKKYESPHGHAILYEKK